METAVLARSEIRVIGRRHIGILDAIEFMSVFCTDNFWPMSGAAPISYGRGPRCREYAFILDREMDLQVLALVVAVDQLVFNCNWPLWVKIHRLTRGNLTAPTFDRLR